jgi:rubredoxin
LAHRFPSLRFYHHTLSLPGFPSPNFAKVLVENFGIKSIGTVKDDCRHGGRQEMIKQTQGDSAMQKWRCVPCDYVYDPAQSDPENGIAPGTAFEDLPEDWLCPDCSAGKDMFKKIE